MANFPLQITYPLPPGVAGTGLDADHPVYFAHPGVPYRTVAAFIGGDGVIQWSMSGQPSGMTIDSDNGAIYWANPTAGSHTGITITATDSANATDSITYDLTVTTTGFVFLDADAVDDSGTGAIGSPWKTIDKLYDQTTDVRAYFMEGTYTFTGVTVSGWSAVDSYTGASYTFAESAGRCTDWRAVPGETVTLDFESDHGTSGSPPTGAQPALRLDGARIHVDGFRFYRGWNKFLWLDRTSTYGAVVTNCTFEEMGPGMAASNSANIMMTKIQDGFSYHDVIAGNHIDTLGITNATTCFWKGYSVMRGYVAFNTGSVDIASTETIALKANLFEINVYRNNIDAQVPLGGNYAVDTGMDDPTGEVRFNRFKGSDWAIEFGRDGECGAHWFIRNTFQGRIVAYNVGSGTHDPDGPFTFHNNVIVNEDGSADPWPYIYDSYNETGAQVAAYVDCETSPTPTGTENLAGAAADNIVDATTGELTAGYAAYLGEWGFEIEAEPQLTQGGHPAMMLAVM